MRTTRHFYKTREEPRVVCARSGGEDSNQRCTCSLTGSPRKKQEAVPVRLQEGPRIPTRAVHGRYINASRPMASNACPCHCCWDDTRVDRQSSERSRR
ncbi:hypothetical protein MRX96_033813 [Rhipicephalus microplus]